MNLLIFSIIMVLIYSYLVGRVLVRYFPQQLGKLKYKLPIGFFTILGILQLVSFPIQYLHVSMSLVTIIYNSIFLVLTGGIIIELYLTIHDKRKNIQRFRTTNLMDYILISFFVIFNFIICYIMDSFGNTYADQSFYITLVENNLNAFQINMILPLSGIISPLSELYNFQGFYLFLTYLSTVFHVDAILIMAWFVPFMLWIIMATTLLNVIHYFKLSYKWYLSTATFLILWTFSDLFEYLVRYNCYGNNFRFFVFVYLMIFYCEYFRNSKIKTLILCGMLWFSAISLQSTALFLGIFLMVSYGLYDLFIVRKRILIPLIFSAIPLIIYLSFFLGYRGSYVPVYLCLGILLCLVGFSLFKRTRILLNQLIYNRGMRIFIVLCVIFMTLLSIWMKSHLDINNSISPTQMLQSIIEKYELQEEYLIPYENWPMIILIGFRRMILFINLYLILHFKQLNAKLKVIVGTQIIMILVIYNPLVCGFISTVSTGIVYTRIEDIVLSIFSVTGFILYASKSPYLKYLVLILSIISALYLVTKTDNYLNTPYQQIKDTENYNHLYRMDQSLIDTAIALDEYIEENMIDERPKVLTTLHHLNYFTSRYEMIYTVEHNRRLDDELYRQSYKEIYVLRDVIEKSYEVEQEVKQQFMPLVYDYDIDFIITSQDIDTWLKEELQKQGKCIFKNNKYSIYRINY